MENTLQRLFGYKAWANDELLAALIKFDSGQIPGDGRRLKSLAVKAMFGGKRSITRLAIKALSHSYVVDRIFAAHMQRKDHAYTSANLSELPTLKGLSADIRASDQEYVDYVSTLDRKQLDERIDFTFTDGAPGRMSREEMLMHVITHGVGHRGQVSALLILNSVAPATDGLTTYLHAAEVSTRRRARA